MVSSSIWSGFFKKLKLHEPLRQVISLASKISYCLSIIIQNFDV